MNYTFQCVRVWDSGCQPRQRYFTFKEYGSEDRAVKAAEAHELTLPYRTRLGRHAPRNNAFSNSQSGIVGVCPFKDRTGEEAGWRANWTEDDHGVRRTRNKDFSYSAHGHQAFTLAKACRSDKVRIHDL